MKLANVINILENLVEDIEDAFENSPVTKLEEDVISLIKMKVVLIKDSREYEKEVKSH